MEGWYAAIRDAEDVDRRLRQAPDSLLPIIDKMPLHESRVGSVGVIMSKACYLFIACQ